MNVCQCCYIRLVEVWIGSFMCLEPIQKCGCPITWNWSEALVIAAIFVVSKLLRPQNSIFSEIFIHQKSRYCCWLQQKFPSCNHQPPPCSRWGGLDHSQGKWFAPGEALPPGFIITAHPEGHTAPQEGHMMSDKAKGRAEWWVYPESHGMFFIGVSPVSSLNQVSEYQKSWMGRLNCRFGPGGKSYG